MKGIPTERSVALKNKMPTIRDFNQAPVAVLMCFYLHMKTFKPRYIKPAS